jgi:iron complex outermembrane receptor protein/outer membrane receptor for ferrienterochelin and colicins
MQVIKNNNTPNHVYFEKNRTTRNTTTFELDKQFLNGQAFKLKQSLAFFNRKISIPGYGFFGLNTNSFTEASYVFNKKLHTLIGGINFIYDNFKHENSTTAVDQTARSFTTGIYAQDTWDIIQKVKIEYGLRFDNAQYKNNIFKNNQSFLLPRVSVLYKINTALSTRIGGGLGYKLPTIFTEQTETMQYQNVQALNNVAAEKSIGGTIDINYRIKAGGSIGISINQLFFYTQINKPMILLSNIGGYYFENAAQPIISKGFETNLKFIYKENLKLFAGYTFTHAKNTYLSADQFLPLLPKSKLNLSLVYEKENNFKIGLESYFSGRQYLYTGMQTPPFWEFGAMAQKTFNKISFFINFENFTDQRQSKYKAVVNPPYNNPTFDDIWNHTEGFVINGGIKIKW